MKTRLHWYLGVAAIVLGFTFEETKAADIKGVVTGPKGPESRRVGDRRDDRPADEIREGGGDRRQGPLPHPRAAERELRRLGQRLRLDRFSQGKDFRRKDTESKGKTGEEREGSGRVLPRDVLVFDAQDSRKERVP